MRLGFFWAHRRRGARQNPPPGLPFGLFRSLSFSALRRLRKMPDQAHKPIRASWVADCFCCRAREALCAVLALSQGRPAVAPEKRFALFWHCRRGRGGLPSRQRSALRCSDTVYCARGAEKACFRSGAVFHGAAGKSFAARRSAGALTPLASPSPLANGPKGSTVVEQAPEISPGAERCTLRAPLAGEPVKDLRPPRAQPTDSGSSLSPSAASRGRSPRTVQRPVGPRSALEMPNHEPLTFNF